jgi:cytochrome c-type biogenesis protein CcmE
MFSRLHKRRIGFVIFAIISCGIATAFVLKAFNENLTFYFLPVEVKAGKAPEMHTFRLGGQVEHGTVNKDGLDVKFSVTDGEASVPVAYTGILPDLFEEGQGVIVQGKINSDGLFMADEVLAKHDEQYKPPKLHEDYIDKKATY